MEKIIINIAIDGLCATGKTLVGKKIAENLNYQFIDSSKIYRYLAYTDDPNGENLDNLQTSLLNDPLLDGIEIGRQASELAQDTELRATINQKLQDITKDKGFVVVGRDVTTNILPDAEVKIILSADFETHVNQRISQQDKLNMNKQKSMNVLLDILNRDNNSIDLIKKAMKAIKS